MYFIVRPLKGIYGVARLGGPINVSIAPMGAVLTPEFPVVWMRSFRIPMKAVAQMKAGTSGMFLGRVTADSRFESKVGAEMLHVCYRKPEWDWSQELALAEKSLVRSADERPPPTDQALFSLDWIERVTQIGHGGGVGGGGVGGGRAGFAGGPAGPPQDFYKLDLPGFIFKVRAPGTVPTVAHQRMPRLILLLLLQTPLSPSQAPSQVIEEMFARSLFGLPAAMKGAPVHPGAPLFIFDENTLLVLGIFQTAQAPAENADPTVFHGQLPVQAAFTIVVEAPPMHMAEPDFISIFPAGPLFGPIGLRETKMLANAFAIRAGVHPPPGAAMMGMGGGGGGGGGGMDYGKAGMGVYKPPLKFVEVVPIDIAAPAFEVKKRVLGSNASLVKQVTQEVGGPTRGVRIRIRGIGSGFYEGTQELQEPMHFNICAESEELLQAAVLRMQEIIARSKAELEHR